MQGVSCSACADLSKVCGPCSVSVPSTTSSTATPSTSATSACTLATASTTTGPPYLALKSFEWRSRDGPCCAPRVGLWELLHGLAAVPEGRRPGHWTFDPASSCIVPRPLSCLSYAHQISEFPPKQGCCTDHVLCSQARESRIRLDTARPALARRTGPSSRGRGGRRRGCRWSRREAGPACGRRGRSCPSRAAGRRGLGRSSRSRRAGSGRRSGRHRHVRAV
jgi:hypothetical protein